MSCTAKVIQDSVSERGIRICTLQLKYQRFIHAELMTHRAFSRNASSSRAIPVAKMIEQVRNDPAMPIHWGKNQPGMQANEQLGGAELHIARVLWQEAALRSADIAEQMESGGLHKQVANRILEPFQWMHVIVTATEWDNFFALRDHPDAQPEIRALAVEMKAAMSASTPNVLKPGQWHLPYVSAEDIAWTKAVAQKASADPETWVKHAKMISAARCCRVSYLKHDGSKATLLEDIALCQRLASANPIHASPFEHQAKPDIWNFDRPLGGNSGWDQPQMHGNFTGWIQNRKVMELELKTTNHSFIKEKK